MAKIKLDNIEYEISEALAKPIKDKLLELEKLNKDHEGLCGRADFLEQELKRKDEPKNWWPVLLIWNC